MVWKSRPSVVSPPTSPCSPYSRKAQNRTETIPSVGIPFSFSILDHLRFKLLYNKWLQLMINIALASTANKNVSFLYNNSAMDLGRNASRFKNVTFQVFDHKRITK